MDFDGPYLSRLLGGKTIGKKVHFLEEVDSTNIYAAELARRGAEEGEAVIADSQQKGRGRLDRTWISPPGANLYTTIILRPPILPASSPQITLTAGVAVAEVLRGYCGDRVTLKWPNDVQVGGKKICGILTELRLKGAEIDYVVVGIGINVNMGFEHYNSYLSSIATSLKEELHREVSRTEVAAGLFQSVEKWYKRFIRQGFAPVREQWLAYSGIIGQGIRVVSGQEVLKGRAVGMDDDGALLILDEDGRTRRVIAGDVLTEGHSCCS